MHRPDDVDHPAGRQRPSFRGRRLTGWQRADPLDQLATGVSLRRPAGAQDRTVDAATAHQPTVRGIHDGIDLLLDDVALQDRDLHGRSLPDPMGHCTTHLYRRGAEPQVGHELENVSELLEETPTVLWIDIDTPTRGDLQLLADELGLHQLSVEDALDEHQRDKYVHFERHVFLACHAVELDVADAELKPIEIDLFVGDRWLVTTHTAASGLIDRFRARWDQVRQTGGEDTGFALYALLDVVVDGYFAILDEFEQFYDAVADHVFAETPIEPSDQRHWFEMRRALNQLAHIVAPLADAVDTLVTRDLDRVGEASRPYLLDLQFELARASGEVTSLRELAQHLSEANLLLRDFRQNAIVKRVTSWAAILAVPTLVTGYFGMNVPYPGTGETWGVIASTGIALGCSAVLYVLFRRNRWL